MSQKSVLIKESILTNKVFLDNKEATIAAGNLLLENGYIEKEYIDSMLEKLETQSFATCIGNGVAIPHVKISGLTKIYGFFSSLERPIDFESADKQPVDLIFTLLAPENSNGTEHLKALAMVSRVFSDKDIRAKLRSSESAESLFAILTSNEDSKAA